MFLPGLERAQAAGLDRRAVGHRIGERHAKLDHVGARFRSAFRISSDVFCIRIARHREGDERGAAFALQVREALIDAGGHLRLRRWDRRGAAFLTALRISAVRMLMVPIMIKASMPTPTSHSLLVIGTPAANRRALRKYRM